MIPSSLRHIRRGMTLIELVIVLGVIAVVAALALPSFEPTGAVHLEAMARILAADLRYTRNLAILHNTDWKLEMLDGDSYELAYAGGGTAPSWTHPTAIVDETNGTLTVKLSTHQPAEAASGDIVLGGMALRESETTVSDITFAALGGTGPARTEDTVLWLIQGSGSQARVIRIVVSWVTGQVWIDPMRKYDSSDLSFLYE